MREKGAEVMIASTSYRIAINMGKPTSDPTHISIENRPTQNSSFHCHINALVVNKQNLDGNVRKGSDERLNNDNLSLVARSFKVSIDSTPSST